MGYMVAVHTGAGNCSQKTITLLTTLCGNVCNEVDSLLAKGASCETAAIAGTCLLENSPLTNAGVGSSITCDKEIRTEASLCSSRWGFHSAGDLPDVEHPIKVVEMMMKETQEAGPKYIPPRIMVGQRAVERYTKCDASISPLNLSTRQSISMFHRAEKYFSGRKRRRLEGGFADGNTGQNSVLVSKDATVSAGTANSPSFSKSGISVQLENPIRSITPAESSNCSTSANNPLDENVQDTVGVICIDTCGEMACAASSGGSVYKYTGRLGQCCVHGAGSYISSRCGVITTGNGEQLINKLLAVTLAGKVDQGLEMLEGCYNEGERRMCGFLMLERDERAGGEEGVDPNKKESREVVTVHAQHSLSNMVIGFKSSRMGSVRVKCVTDECPAFMEVVRL